MGQSSGDSGAITKCVLGGLDVVTVSRPCFKKFYITGHAGKGSQPYSVFENLARFVQEKNARIVAQDVFGCCEFHDDGMRALERSCGRIGWPVTWIQGDGWPGKSLAGTQVYAISGAPVEPIRLNGRVVGSMFDDDDARYCLLGDLRAADISRSRPEQTRETFEKAEAALRLAEMDFSNVLRTWLYVDNILSWYDEFNKVRDEFFRARGLFEGVVPASTGIGVGNPAGAALVADVFAIKAKRQNVRIRTVASPLQCSASEYGSSFSRALEVVLPGHIRLYVSGTASIHRDGRTAHVGNVEEQIALSMEVVQAILEHREMGWPDVTRAVAYFKDIENTPLFDKYCKESRLPPLPVAIVHGDICRDELLYEIEVDAVKSRT